MRRNHAFVSQVASNARRARVQYIVYLFLDHSISLGLRALPRHIYSISCGHTLSMFRKQNMDRWSQLLTIQATVIGRLDANRRGSHYGSTRLLRLLMWKRRKQKTLLHVITHPHTRIISISMQKACENTFNTKVFICRLFE
jgi:hypothetical protein